MTAARKTILNAGDILNDKWLIMDLIGKGAMGEVYQAHQLNLKRDVAVKVISEEWLKTVDGETGGKETTLQRFQREFQAMAQVRHPNILQIYDYGSDSIQKEGKGVPLDYIVMEYIPGATFRFTMSEEGFEPDEQLIKGWLKEYFLPVLDGVQAMHALGIVHRDLKPENILLDGLIPKIADFGLARSNRLRPLSYTADAQGTLTYMPPEQFVDFKRVDQRGDIYSLGRILFEAISGRISQGTVPFKQVKLSNSGTPFLQDLDRIIQWATTEDRDQRLETVEKLRSLLLEAIRNLETEKKPDSDAAPPLSRWPRPKWIWAGMAATVFSVILMAFWHYWGDPGRPLVFWKKGQKTGHELTQPNTTTPSLSISKPLKDFPPSMMGEDGLNMLLIPGGDFQVNHANGDDPRRKVRITPFYMDENKVSYEKFADFLNEVKDTLVVDKGVVKSNGQIWFLMGEGTESYEHIIYQHGRFHLKEPQAAGQPVVRVTWYGASAYALHFHKQLPTEDQWIFAAYHGRFLEDGALKGKKASPNSGNSGTSASINGRMSHTDYSAEKPPQKGLSDKSKTPGTTILKNPVFPKDMGGEVKEWAVRSNTEKGMLPNPNAFPKQDNPESIILGKPSLLGKLEIRSELISNRYPWEGFPKVGFRCIIDVRVVN
jgi:eukaryotic-like serine/threonine-protein kinase